MMEDYKGSATSFFPLPFVCVGTCMYALPNEHLEQNGIRYEPRKTLSGVRRGTFGLNSLMQEAVQRLNMEMI